MTVLSSEANSSFWSVWISIYLWQSGGFLPPPLSWSRVMSPSFWGTWPRQSEGNSISLMRWEKEIDSPRMRHVLHVVTGGQTSRDKFVFWFFLWSEFRESHLPIYFLNLCILNLKDFFLLYKCDLWELNDFLEYLYSFKKKKKRITKSKKKLAAWNTRPEPWGRRVETLREGRRRGATKGMGGRCRQTDSRWIDSYLEGKFKEIKQLFFSTNVLVKNRFLFVLGTLLDVKGLTKEITFIHSTASGMCQILYLQLGSASMPCLLCSLLNLPYPATW